jgi:hypothetical protein
VRVACQITKYPRKNEKGHGYGCILAQYQVLLRVFRICSKKVAVESILLGRTYIIETKKRTAL